MGLKIILTGATGYVGEGVLLECLEHPAVDEVLVVGRKSCGRQHRKLKELLVKDFFSMNPVVDRLRGYDGSFFCAGISSVGMKEEPYKRFTYDATLAFARSVYGASPGAVFTALLPLTLPSPVANATIVVTSTVVRPMPSTVTAVRARRRPRLRNA